MVSPSGESTHALNEAPLGAFFYVFKQALGLLDIQSQSGMETGNDG